MAGRILIKNKLYPQDYNGSYGSLSIRLPMNNARTKNQSEIFNLSYTTEEQSISNFINLLLTKDGERFMQPNFGVGLYYYIFEQNVIALNSILETKIRDQVAFWLPYIVIDDIRISNLENKLQDENSLNIEIKFSVLQTGANRRITIFTTAERNFNIEVE